MGRQRSVLLAVVVAVLLAAPAARAVPVPAVDFTGYGVSGLAEATLGWEFTTNLPVAVTHLGIYDLNQGGLAGSHEVGIFTGEGDLLFSATVSPSDPLDGMFRYTEIEPFVLDAGGRYIIGGSNDGGADTYVGGATGFTTHAAIDYVHGRSKFGPGLQFPTDEPGAPPETFGPNFKLEVVPEPATMSLAVLGLAGLGLRRRRRRRA